MVYKHLKRMPVVACGVVLITISIIMSLFLFSTEVKAAIFGPKYFYLSIERQNYKKAVKELKDKYSEKNLMEYSYAGSINAMLTGDLVNSNEDMKKVADILSKFKLNFKYNANGKNSDDIFYTSSFDADFGQKKLLDVDVKYADNKALIAFPEMTDKIIGFENSNIAASSKYTKAILEEDEIAFEEVFGLNREAYDKLIEKYLKDIIIAQIPDEKVKYIPDVPYKNIICNAITFNIDEETISSIFKAVADELRTDKEFNTLYKSTINSFYDMAYEAYEIDKPEDMDIDDQIQTLCDELYNQAEDIEDINIAYTVFFKNSGDIIYRQIKDRLSNTKIVLEDYTDMSGLNIFKFNFETGGEKIFAFTNEEKLQNGIYNGKFNLDITEKPILEASYTYEKDAKVGNLSAFVGEVKGNIDLEQFTDNEITDYVNNDISNISFSFTNQKKGEDTLLGEAKVYTNIDGQSIQATLSSEIKQSNVANILKPEVNLSNTVDLYDQEGLGELASDILEHLTNNFPELFPESTLDDSLIFNDNDIYEYDEYYGLDDEYDIDY